MLFGLETVIFRDVSLGKLGQSAVSVLGIVPVVNITVNRKEARETHCASRCAEHIAAARQIGRDGIEIRIFHLTCDKPLPDELIELILIGGQLAAYIFGNQ